MSDPLTALMHAVQVMNLLKTLITKTVREREENATGGYSPMSSCSSEHQTDEDFDSQQEMETSYEFREQASDEDDENARYSHSSEDENEVQSLCDIEECFLRQLDHNKTVTSSFMDQPAGDLQEDYVSTQCCSGSKMESGISFSDSKEVNSGLSTSDGEDSGKFMIAMRNKVDTKNPSIECAKEKDVEMDVLEECVSPLSLPSSKVSI